MKITALLFSLMFTFCIYAQVGVGTTTPDPSAVLDITATNQGVLVPRVALTDVADATVPINAPATGLLIWNTNGAVTGGSGVGFYFFNGAQWVAIQQAQVDDADFYEEGTTTAPDDINDDMYTQGNIGIGQVTADYKLDITEDTGLKAVDISVTGDVDGNRVAIDNNISGTQNPGIANQIYGLRNTIFSGGGFGVYGVENRLSGNYSSLKNTVSNVIDGGTGNHFGISNSLSGSDPTTSNLRIGVQNQFNYNDPSNGSERGISTIFSGTSTGTKYGVFSSFEFTSDATLYGMFNRTDFSSGNGSQFGVYNLLSSEGSGFLYGGHNYFRGSGTGNNTGLFNGFESLGGSEYYGLHNEFSGSSTVERGVFNNFVQSDSANRYGLYNIFDSTDSLSPTDYGVFTIMTGNSTSNQYGIYQSIGTTGAGTHYGFFNQLNGGGGLKFAIENEITIPNSAEGTGVHSTLSAATSSASATGSHNEFLGSASEMTGVKNEFSGSEALQTKGVDNDFSGFTVTGSNNYGLFSIFNNNSNGSQYGTYNQFTSALGEMYGTANLVSGGTQRFYGLYNQVTSTASSTEDKYGVYNVFDSAAGGAHYGVYSSVLKAGSYAGYFLGDVSIGTTAVNTYILPDSDGIAGQIMQTDGAGNVDWVDNNDNSTLSLVRVNLSSTYNQSATGATWVNIDFDNEIFDTNAEFNTATNTFTAASAGYYRVNASYHTTAQSNTGYFGIAIYVNGTLYAESTHNHHNVGDVMRQVNCLVALAVSDTVEVRIRAESNAVDIDGFGGKTFMEIEQVKRN
ncbi:hypothetical protein [Winogradskyella aquimaris]|uniref:C1q domain-containing protein n=1 Tax=Winogradskyella aquimaris TaxID=864074 RepID=A0ABU5EN99_9FLAO|nr:hypothetical protein [Winogradskyella aquimaris]MDY2587743.1 hypothetical protein [Winogradskyella aquimaris]